MNYIKAIATFAVFAIVAVIILIHDTILEIITDLKHK